tara:strand:+ start:1545 stop:1862 length:318 start_codon:yes stop_codon:yes gene_type:complete
MFNKNKGVIFIQRILFWALYFFSGFILYSKKGNLYQFLISFSRIIYPLSIFWLQIRFKKRTNFLPIDSKMTTSQLWFNLLPVIASLLTVIFSLTNTLLFILGDII